MCPGWTLRDVVRPGGLELPTFWFVARRSIQLSYGRTVVQLLYFTPFTPLLQLAPRPELWSILEQEHQIRHQLLDPCTRMGLS
jgi:hypothetical protein